MIVIQRVVDHLAVSTVFYDTGLFQIFQLVRYRRLFHVQQSTDVAHTHFRLTQRPQDPDPRTISKKFKKVRQFVQLVTFRKPLPDIRNRLHVNPLGNACHCRIDIQIVLLHGISFVRSI